MSVPTYEELMRPLLEVCKDTEVSISNTVDTLAVKLGLSDEDLAIVIPSGKQTRFSNRVNWAKSYLKQAGLVKATKRAHFIITERGLGALKNNAVLINKEYLTQFEEFQEFQSRKGTSSTNNEEGKEVATYDNIDISGTPDEALREAHQRINNALASDLLDRVRDASPDFSSSL